MDSLADFVDHYIVSASEISNHSPTGTMTCWITGEEVQVKKFENSLRFQQLVAISGEKISRAYPPRRESHYDSVSGFTTVVEKRYSLKSWNLSSAYSSYAPGLDLEEMYILRLTWGLSAWVVGRHTNEWYWK